MNSAPFARLFASERGEVPLDLSALLISVALRGPLDEVEWLAMLDEIAAGCPAPTPDAVAGHLIDGLGFRGNRTGYYDWRNSCLDHVLAHRSGIPITLAVVMIEVGRRIGVELHGVDMPGHFLVATASDDVFFDLFHGASPLDRDGTRGVFERLADGRSDWQESYLDSVPNRLIVIRMLNNLRSIFASRGDAVPLAIVMQLRAAIPELQQAERNEIDRALAVLN